VGGVMFMPHIPCPFERPIYHIINAMPTGQAITAMIGR